MSGTLPIVLIDGLDLKISRLEKDGMPIGFKAVPDPSSKDSVQAKSFCASFLRGFDRRHYQIGVERGQLIFNSYAYDGHIRAANISRDQEKYLMALFPAGPVYCDTPHVLMAASSEACGFIFISEAGVNTLLAGLKETADS